jgi:pyridoxamine 5'-phosphate oxidase
VSTDPLTQFREWYEHAVAAGVVEPEAMALATASADGAPSVRFVLLKGIDARGVEFFTNYESRKGGELIANPRAALAVLWKPLERQVRLEGPVEVLTPEESDEYFASRSRGSRLGAWASRQSEVIPDREWLEARLAEVGERFPDAVPRPPHWGGFRLLPSAVEFWEGRPSRLHDREVFTRDADGAWVARRLSP